MHIRVGYKKVLATQVGSIAPTLSPRDVEYLSLFVDLVKDEADAMDMDPTILGTVKDLLKKEEEGYLGSLQEWVPRCTGLERVSSECDGHSAWVSPQGKQEFMDRGVGALEDFEKVRIGVHFEKVVNRSSSTYRK